jgi:hypothetical protein
VISRQRDWAPLATLVVSESYHHPDAIEAIEAVRPILETRTLRYLDPAAVVVDANPTLRAAIFRFTHSAEPETVVEIRQGDGYTALLCPLGEYHGYVPEPEFADFVEATLDGRLIQTRGSTIVGDRLSWTAQDGTTHDLRQGFFRRALARLLPTSEARLERHSLSFDRLPAVMRID